MDHTSVTSNNHCLGTTPLLREEVLLPRGFRCLCCQETTFLLLEPELEDFSRSTPVCRDAHCQGRVWRRGGDSDGRKANELLVQCFFKFWSFPLLCLLQISSANP